MERISALMDGELEDFEVTGQLKQLVTDQSMQTVWREYHLIGDVLRREPMRNVVLSEKFHAALETEPTVLAPRAIPTLPHKARLYAMSAAASVAGVAAVAWLAFVNYPAGQVSILATGPAITAPIVAAAARPEVTEYLQAHQEYSPRNTMQGVGSYIRTVGLQENEMSR